MIIKRDILNIVYKLCLTATYQGVKTMYKIGEAWLGESLNPTVTTVKRTSSLISACKFAEEHLSQWMEEGDKILREQSGGCTVISIICSEEPSDVYMIVAFDGDERF